MEFGTDRCLQLIAAYQARPELWQPSADNYRNKLRKQEAWKEIADEVDSTVDVVKAKMNSLLSSFRRERAKETTCPNQSTVVRQVRAEKQYKSRWFAFPALQFLLHERKKDNNIPTGVLGADSGSQTDGKANKDEDEVEFEIGEDGLTTLEGDVSLGSTPNNDADELRYCDKSPRRTISCDIAANGDYDQRRAKRFKSSYKEETLFDYENLTAPTNSENSRDVCELYGAYLATKLRSYSKQTQTVVQYLTNNILFKADMGYYDNQLDIEEPIRINRHQPNSNIGNLSTSSLGIILPKVEQVESLE